MQQFYSVTPVYCKGNYNKCVTKEVLLLQVTVYGAYSDFTCNFQPWQYYKGTVKC